MTDPNKSTSKGKSKPKAKKSSGEGRGGPARGYSWRTAGAGNTLAVTHGTRSARAVNAAAQAVLAEVLAERPWLEQFPEEARAYARAEAVARMLFNYIAEVGIVDEDNELRESVLREARRWARFAAERVEAALLSPRAAVHARGYMQNADAERERMMRDWEAEGSEGQRRYAEFDGVRQRLLAERNGGGDES